MYFDNRPGTYILNARIRLEEGTNNSQVYFDGMGVRGGGGRFTKNLTPIIGNLLRFLAQVLSPMKLKFIFMGIFTPML